MELASEQLPEIGWMGQQEYFCDRPAGNTGGMEKASAGIHERVDADGVHRYMERI